MNRKLYVGNLAYETTEADLQTLFSQSGAVETVRVMRDMATGRARGFAFVDILQACPTYNHFATHTMLMEKCYNVESEKHDTSDFKKARQLAVDTGKRIATGILYRREDIPNFYERLVPRQGKTTTPVDEVAAFDVTKLMEEFI